MRTHASRIAVCATLVTVAAGCGGPSDAPGRRDGSRVEAVPNSRLEAPPDTIPTAIDAPSNLTMGPPRLPAAFVRNIVAVRFEPEASPEERAAAVNAVGGAVVGFSRLADGDGFYFVQIPDDGTDEPLFAAIETLAAFPAVQWAGPEVILQVNLEDAFDSSPSHGPDREERARPLPPTQP